MINKNLEQKLKKGGFNDIVTWLEKCEKGKIKVLEIRVDKAVGITGRKLLDSAIVEYLKELNIKVLYSEYSSKKAVAAVVTNAKDTKAKCQHFSHKLLNKKLNYEDNVSNFLENKVALFKIDENVKESYGICPDCTSMIKIS